MSSYAGCRELSGPTRSRTDGAPLAWTKVLRELARLRFSLTLLVAVISTSIVLDLAGPSADLLLDRVSTNVRNLTHRPLGSLVGSALVEPTAGWIFELALLVGVALLLERRIGSLRTLAVFASGHVIATVLTESWVGASIQLGVLPESARARLDVGTSYGMWAMIGTLVWYLGRYRFAAAAAAALYLGTTLLVERDMTSAGHVLSLTIGLCWWAYLARRSTSAVLTPLERRQRPDGRGTATGSAPRPVPARRRGPSRRPSWR